MRYYFILGYVLLSFLNFTQVSLSDQAILLPSTGKTNETVLKLDPTYIPGDLLCEALPIIVNASEISGDNTIATSEINEPKASCWWPTNPINSIWYYFTAPLSGKITASTSFNNTSLSDSHIAIYEVGDCQDMTSLTELACNEDGGIGSTAIAEVNGLIPENTYYIQVDGYLASKGEFKLKVYDSSNCPYLSSPSNGVNNVSLSAILNWDSIPNMNGYIINIGTSSGATNIENNLNLGNNLSFSPATDWIPNTTYFVTLIAYNIDGNETGCIETSFSTIALPSTSQGPGGIVHNNVFWVRADKGVSVSNSQVSSWEDQSAGTNHATQANSLYQPSIEPDLHNYNSGIYFDGTNQHLSINNLIAANSKNISVFAIGTNEAGGDSWHSMVFGQSNNGWNGGGYGICGLDGNADSFGFWINNWNSHSAATHLTEKQTTILEGKYEGQTIKFFKNAHLEALSSYNDTIGQSGTTHLGGGRTTAYNHKGYITEVAIYDTDLSSQERNKVNSYFAIKYGITLDQTNLSAHYINSSGNTIYASEHQYWNNIIGIGRDDNSALLQKQSHQANDSTRIYLSSLEIFNKDNTGSYLTDNQFVIIGNNGQQLQLTTQVNNVPNGLFRIIDRDWKIQNTNFDGNFNIDLLLSNCTESSTINNTDIRLLVSSNPDFSDAQIFNNQNGLSLQKFGNLISIKGISNIQLPKNTSAFITIATIKKFQSYQDFNATLCTGDSMIINGTTYNQTNPSGTETFTSTSGCDSIINVDLSFQNSFQTNLEQVLCFGETLAINGTIYSQANPSGTETLSSTSGCDSIININLNFQNKIQINLNQDLCFGESLVVNGTTYDQENPSGTETLSSFAGCDSIININLQFIGDTPILKDDYYHVDATKDLNTQVIKNDHLPDFWELTILESNHDNWFKINTEGFISLQHSNPSTDESITILYQVCNSECNHLCDTAQITIQFSPILGRKDVFASEILTLNGDGKNDQLVFKGLNTFTNQGIKIFNRWGDLIFAQAPYQNNWSGKNQHNQELPNGTYYYILTIEYKKNQVFKGDVLLIR